MQRRKSTKSQDLPRRKSTSSVKNVQLVYVHPDTAEHDAQSAAAEAFTRARDRASNSVAYWPPPRSSERPAMKRNHSSPEKHADNRPVRRQQSVRFVQPKSSSSRFEDEKAPYTPSNQRRTRARTSTSQNQMHQTQRLQSRSNATASGIVSAAKGAAGDYINTLLVKENHREPEDDIAIFTSSSSRLRKAKSMYPGSDSGVAQGAHNASYNETSTLRAPRSMSALRPRQETSMTSTSNDNILTVAANSEPSTKGIGPRITKSQSSAQLRSKSIRQDKTFKKTLRNRSDGTASLRVKGARDGSLRLKARQVSQNVKHKLKTFFSTMRGDSEDSGLPPQQVEARRTHVTELKEQDHDLEDSHSEGTGKETTTVSRVSSGIPSFHNIPLEHQLQSRQGSLESLHSERKASDERSRVTSWSDSDATTCGTVNSSQNVQGKHRLSVIKETRTNNISNRRRRPVYTKSTNTPEGMVQTNSNTDSSANNSKGQRLYSALMKRNGIEVPKKVQASHNNSQKSLEIFVEQDLVPTRGSSRSFSSSKTTIINNINKIEQQPGIAHGMRFNATKNDLESMDDPFVNDNNWRLETSNSSNNVSRAMHNASLQHRANVSTRSLTDTDRRKPASPLRTLSARSSAFFGSPECHLFRTQSPYRRAVRGSMQAAAKVSPAKSPAFNPWTMPLPAVRIRRPSTSESENDQKMAYEESIYSNDVELLDAPSSIHGLVQNFPQPSEKHGHATIFLDPPTYQSPRISASHRNTSSTSSVDWKSWLSANISELDGQWSGVERPESGNRMVSQLDLTCGGGHVRENAQIDGDEEEMASPPKVEALGPADQVSCAVQRNLEGSPKQLGTSLNHPRTNEASAPRLRPVATPRHSISNALKVEPSMTHRVQTNRVNENLSSIGIRGDCNISKPRNVVHARSLGALKTQDQNVTALQRYESGTPLKVAGKRIQQPASTPSCQKIENLSPRFVAGNDANQTKIDGASSVQSSASRQSMTSKDMVELFLDSRRRRIAGTDDTNAFI